MNPRHKDYDSSALTNLNSQGRCKTYFSVEFRLIPQTDPQDRLGINADPGFMPPTTIAVAPCVTPQSCVTR